ncbi:MAG: DUF2382 domain-containing protein [Pyrinomonadaceae bacterium]|nr:DUF2382 domain-containing protein [Pyrinomonadaceae bacterium]MDQ3133689.1 YsnF/AvaK domain-containing protein [Acidobacteriota bacterium]
MTKTVVGLFDVAADAQRAARELLNSGFRREDIGISSQDYEMGGAATTRAADAGGESVGDKIGNFFSSLFGGATDERVGYYSEAVRRGGVVLTVDAETDEMASRAAAILDNYGAADINERAEQYRASGYTGYDARAPSRTTGEARRERDTYRAGNLDQGGEAVLPVVEEELRVGKRQVEHGGVRVRSHVVERPVEEVVRLREERVSVERRPVNRSITDADMAAFKEGTIEVIEMGEEVVVDKQTRVVEEVVVNKEVVERDETVRDTVRRTDVEVEELNPRGAPERKGKGSSGR